MSHIPQHLLLPQDKVDIRDEETGRVTRMHASDARHAMDVEPNRYVLAGLKKPEPEVEPEAEQPAAEEEKSVD